MIQSMCDVNLILLEKEKERERESTIHLGPIIIRRNMNIDETTCHARA